MDKIWDGRHEKWEVIDRCGKNKTYIYSFILYSQ